MRTLSDTYRHKGLRKGLVKTISEKGIESPAVLKAIGKVPRHFFFDDQPETQIQFNDDMELRIQYRNTMDNVAQRIVE